jgi:hypothetical protein
MNTELEFPNFEGIDVEPEDRSVGIFGNTFALVFSDSEDTNKQTTLYLDDNEMLKLWNEMKRLCNNEVTRL